MSRKYKYTRTFTYEGKRYYVHADTLEDIGRKKAEKLAELKAVTVKESNITVSEYAYRCVELYKTGQKQITRDKYIARMNHCILEYIGSHRIQDITPEHCQRILNLQSGKSKTQINEVYQTLRFIFSHAVFDGLITKDPTSILTRPQGTTTPRRALMDNEREPFLNVASSDRKYFGFLLSYYCGCRPSEAEACMMSDITESDGLTLLHIRGTKTAKADRYVPVPGSMLDLIQDLPPHEPIGIYPSGRPLSYDNRHRLWHGLWYKMNIEAGAETYRNKIITPVISHDLTPYCLRHDYCTRLAKAGVDIRTAQKLMGHSTITLTANIYTHVDNDDLRLAAALIDS